MRFKLLAALMLCFTLLIGAAYANVTLTTDTDLGTSGMPADKFNPISFSPDSQYLAGWVRGTKEDIAKGEVYKIFLLTLGKDGSISKVKGYPLNIPSFEQACFTPDGQSMVVITKSGATFVKLDFATGKVSTVMEHKRGEAGFRSYPTILQIAEGQMLATGYFYDAKDFARSNCTAILDPNKTGVEAFTFACETGKMQHKLKGSNEAFPQKDLGFIGVHNKDAQTYKFYRCKANDNNPLVFDTGIQNKGFWASASRILYSVQKSKDSYDLAVYDGKTDKKVMLAQGTDFPYMYVFLSSDGTTAVVNNANDKQRRTKLYYARESEGWALKPITGLERGISTGTLRISPDGSRLMLHNKAGIRIIDVK